MLRHLKLKDANYMLEWMHDREIQKNFRQDMMSKTLGDVKKFILESSISIQNGKSSHFAIIDQFDEYMGTISLKNIDLKSYNAEYAISLRRKAQGKGIAYRATLEILELAFIRNDFEKIYLNVYADNKQAIRLYERCGFTLEGEFRKHFFNDGKYRNLRWYSILKEEYKNMIKYTSGRDINA